MITDVGCVVVHHCNYPGILRTVDAILKAKIPAERIILVDNSEDSAMAELLRLELPAGVRLLLESNLGYGHAANAGARMFRTLQPSLRYILISTHEAVPDPEAISAMVGAFDSDRVDVVGPTLWDNTHLIKKIWSTGGELSRFLNIPTHSRRITRELLSQSLVDVDRAWLDGAFCLYRADTLADTGFPEQYFLYFEEVDLHLQIRNSRGRVVWAPTANVSQVSSGTPPYYLTRNMVIFQFRHGNLAQQLVTPAYSAIRFAVRSGIKTRSLRGISELWRGYVDGQRMVRQQSRTASGDSGSADLHPTRTTGA